MLHRAANNAYSWWWAGHIRTKQSKWLEQNLQDMEEKVKYMLKLIEEDGDSFAKRAEMYYRRRPELINFVEESYRAYRALAERYDHISGDLQNANHTIATVFPEQVQLAMDDEEQYGSQNTHAHSIDPRKLPERLPEVPKANIPGVPKFLNRAIQGSPALTTKKVRLKKTDTTTTTTNSSSQISKDEALEEIDKLQKGILALQTEKEFVKSSYESRLAKYWEIEKSITEMQEKVGGLQDEFSVCTVIEDNDARTLMAATALKSCQETLVQLQEKQERSVEEAEVEYQRIKDAHEKLEAIKDEFVHNGKDRTLAEKEFMEANPTLKNLEQSELIREKIREHFEMNSDPSLTVTELAEKIDELVTKVISLETAVSSQTALIERLRSETNELQAHLQGLEEDKTTTTMKGSNNLSKKLRELEEELCVIQGLNRNVDDQNSNLQTHFTEAHCNLGHLSEKLQSMKHPDEEINGMDPVEAEKGLLKQEDMVLPPDDGSSLCVKDREESLAQPKSSNDLSEKNQELKMRGEAEIKDSSETEGSVITLEPQEPSMDREDLPTHFTEAHCNLGHLSEKLQSMKHLDNKINVVDPVRVEVGLLKQEDMVTPPDDDLSLCVKDREESPAQPKSSNNISEKSHELKKRDEAEIKDSSETKRSVNTFEPQEPSMDRKDLPTLQELLLHGLEDKEKILLTEYTSILWKYKEAKKRLSEEEKKKQDNLFETTVQVRELKSSNTMKDKEIRSLRQKLNLLQTSSDENTHLTEFDNIESRNVPTVNLDHNDEATEGPDKSTAEEVEEVKVILINELHTVSTFEEKFRRDIDELLEENLEFWLRFSTSFLQIQKFQTAIQDLQSEFLKLKENMKQKSNNITTDRSLKSDALPIYKHLREIQAELTVWFEQNILLKDELQSRLSSLRKIQEEIVRVSKANSRTKDVKFTGYQAAKFQGEVSNMQQENNKVANELQAGLDRVRGLQIEMEKTLSKMDEDFKLSESKNHHPQMKYSTSRTRVPLRSFIFGVKSKKHKPSIFSCMSPALQRQYSDLKGNPPI